MSANAKQDQFRLGFLTAIEVTDQGYVGGLLVTNRHGRPLEFQCTAPVKPNRTQEILYGPTLGPFLLGELIGKTLIEKSSVKPHLILTEKLEILELRNHISLPVACIQADDGAARGKSAEGADGSDASTTEPASKGSAKGGEATLRLGRQMVRFHAAHTADSQAFTADPTLVPRDANLREPFERVREALQETLRSGALK